MPTRRDFLKKCLGLPFVAMTFHLFSYSWAQTRKLLSKGFPRAEIADMNPAEIDGRNLDVDPLDTFGTMGPTDISVDLKTFALKVTGKVEHPFSLSYDQVLKYPSVTEIVLLICPGFFSNNGRWTGVSLKALLQQAQVREGAEYVDINGAQEKVTRIAIKDLDRRRIFLAHHVNGTPLPQKHGFPLRLVYEDAYGSDWVKYVNAVVVS